MPILDPNELVGSAFLITQEDDQLLRAIIVKDIDYHDIKIQLDYSRLKFIFWKKDDAVEDLFTCNEILDQINN